MSLLAVLSLTLATVSPASATPKDERGSDAVILLTKNTPVLKDGETQWIQLYWTSQVANATDFQVTSVASSDVKVDYPTNTGEFTSLYRDDILSASELDYTSFKLDVPKGTKKVKMELTVSYMVGSKEVVKTKTVQFKVL